MSLDPKLRQSLSLPAVCAPMFLVSGPDLVREACKAGVIGALPRQNARSFEEFAGWLRTIHADLREHAARAPGPIGSLAVNLSAKTPEGEIAAHLDLCVEQGVDIVITVGGSPKLIVQQAHDRGIKVFHDITSIPFAERAIAAGVDGLICIGAGGGGLKPGSGNCPCCAEPGCWARAASAAANAKTATSRRCIKISSSWPGYSG